MLIRKRNGLIVKQGGLLARNCRQLVTPSGCSACVAAGLAPAGYTVTLSGVRMWSDTCGNPLIATQRDPPAPVMRQAADECQDQMGSILLNASWNYTRDATQVPGATWCHYTRTSAYRTCTQCKDVSGDGYNPGTYIASIYRAWVQISVAQSTLYPEYPQYTAYLRVAGKVTGYRLWTTAGCPDNPDSFPAGVGDPANDSTSGNAFQAYFPIDSCGRLIGWTTQANQLTSGLYDNSSPPQPCHLLGSATVAMT